MSLRHCVLLGAVTLTLGCSGPAYLGSDLFWYSGNEDADTADWTVDTGGGTFAGFAGSDVALTTERAHGGRQSLHFVTPAMGIDSGSNVYRNVAVPSEAYYSAWFLIPELYSTRSYLTIMKFHSYDPDEREMFDNGVDVRLRDVSNGQFVLYLLHHDGAFLQAPLPLPPPLVSPGRWFHVEVFFRAALDTTGAIALWLDGRKLYDLPARPTVVRERAYFSVCDMAKQAMPESVEVFVDDVAVSRTRVTERGAVAGNR